MRELSAITGELRGLQEKRNGLSEEIDKLMATNDVDEGVQQRMERLQRGSAKLTDRISEIEVEHGDVLRERADLVRRSALNSRNVEYGDGAMPRGQEPWNRPDARGEVDPRRRSDFNAAMRSIESVADRDGFSNESAKRVESMLRTSDLDGVDARYLAAVGNPHYASAFWKVLPDPTRGHLSLTPEEGEAMRSVRLAELSQRAMGDATGSAGGFGIPIQIDPSIVLTNVGALNPLRQIARVETVSSYVWRGVSSDGVVAGFGAEAAEASDNSPTLVQPTMTSAKGFAFVPFSFELSQDYPGLENELLTLLNDAKNVVEATKFLLGTGANEPGGILNVGGTGGLVQANSRVLTATTATFAYADLWTLKQAIPIRFLPTSTVVMNPTTLDTTYQLSPAGSTTLALLMPEGRGGPLIGLPVAQLSTLATGAVTGTKTAVVGDFKKGFFIGDRLGAQASYIPHLFGAANRYPTGQSGLYLYWRVGSTTIGSASATGSPLRYLEIK